MLYKNTGKKVLGFGTLVMPPDAVETLPAGYDENHPTVKFLIDRKWLTVVKGGKAATPPAEPPPELTEEEKAAAAAKTESDAKRAAIDTKIKAVARMNRDQLNAEAAALGVEFAESDNNDQRKAKLTEKLQADMAEVG